MKIVFFGNTKFSLIGARIIHENIGISQIVTLPDRPDKRGRLTQNPMKTFAQENNIPCLTVDKLDKKTIDYLAALHPDFLIVEDYGLILPKSLLDLPKYTNLNIHHSLLPKYRGPSPAPFAILAGDKVTGVTVIKMAEKVDAGDIFAQKEYQIQPAETMESLLTELNKLGGEIILPVIKNYKNMKPQPQDEHLATYTKMLNKQDGYIDLSLLKKLSGEARSRFAGEIARKIRAYYPWPTVWTKWKMANGQWKIIKFLPSSVIAIRQNAKLPAEKQSHATSFALQVEGKNPVSIKDFLNGYPEMKEKIEKLFS